ncbi:MAG: hypothetical protein ACTIJ9_04670 [Aequorivita sp.]
MKNTFLVFVLITFLLFGQKSFAQTPESNFIYGNAGVSAGNYLGIEGGINYIKNEKLYFGINYSIRQNDANNEPDGYSAGFFGPYSVNNHHHSFIASTGYVMPLNPSKTIRLVLKGGAGLRLSRIPTNYQAIYSGSTWFSGKYYTYDYHNRYSVEIIINPALEFAFARGYGLSVSPVVSVGSGRTFFGASINNIFGIVRNRTKKSNQEAE